MEEKEIKQNPVKIREQLIKDIDFFIFKEALKIFLLDEIFCVTVTIIFGIIIGLPIFIGGVIILLTRFEIPKKILTDVTIYENFILQLKEQHFKYLDQEIFSKGIEPKHLEDLKSQIITLDVLEKESVINKKRNQYR